MAKLKLFNFIPKEWIKGLKKDRKRPIMRKIRAKSKSKVTRKAAKKAARTLKNPKTERFKRKRETNKIIIEFLKEQLKDSKIERRDNLKGKYYFYVVVLDYIINFLEKNIAILEQEIENG